MKKTIYITSLHLQHGGIENVITLLANAFSEKGFPVKILCTYRLGEPAYEINPNVEIIYLTNSAPNKKQLFETIRKFHVISLFKELKQALRTLWLKYYSMKCALSKIDDGIVIATRNEHALLLSKYGKPSVLKIAQLHSDHNFRHRLIFDYKFRYQNIDFFVLLTKQTRDEVALAIKKYNHHTKCIFIPNFYEPSSIYSKKAVSCTKINQIIAVGRLSPEKGIERLLHIWAKASLQLPDWKLKVVGGGPLAEALKKTTVDLKLTQSVEFTGMLPYDKVIEEMLKSRLYVMTSFTEAFPMVLLEAQTYGLPVIAYDVRVGPRAIISNCKNGFLIPDGDEQQFVDRLTFLAKSEDTQIEFSNNGKLAVTEFSKENVLSLWLDTFKQGNEL